MIYCALFTVDGAVIVFAYLHFLTSVLIKEKKTLICVMFKLHYVKTKQRNFMWESFINLKTKKHIVQYCPALLQRSASYVRKNRQSMKTSLKEICI